MRAGTFGWQPKGLAAFCSFLMAVTQCLIIPVSHSTQQPLADHSSGSSLAAQRRLKGRFLHITDLHPDRFYKTYSATEANDACHRGEGPAGYYGAETSDCDSPVSLINATFDWIDKEVRDSIDFVIWTGDSARHDNDEEIPRTREQVVGLNRLVAQKFEEIFDTRDHDKNPYNDLSIPIIPTFGNNDILPHNIFDAGPNLWTNTYLDIWRKFIPEEQRHQFAQGGWFSVDVIPRRLVVFSLNSLYFFDNNAAVDGCSLKSEPGYRQLNWLRIQLQFARERGMKAMIIGHVPPARTYGKSSWDETCWQKYTLWQRQYRDVIVGSFYGHMNYDHFMFQDFHDIDPSLDEGYGIEAPSTNEADDIEVASVTSYFSDLRKSWTRLPTKPRSMSKFDSDDSNDGLDALQDMSDDARPTWEVDALRKGKKDNRGKKGKKDKKSRKDKEKKKAKKYLDAIGGEYAEMFSVSFVAPSVVPNYFPTIRIYEYNITGLEHTPIDARDNVVAEEEDPDEYKMEKKKDKSRKKRKFTVPKPPSKSAPPGPAYSPQPLTLLGYTQYYANLTYINNDFSPDNVFASDTNQDLDVQKWNEGKHGKHNGKKPKSDAKPKPNKFEYQVLYNTTSDEIYKLKDMTVRSYLGLAKRIGKKVKKSKKRSLAQELVSLDGEASDDAEQDSSDDVEVTKKGKKDKKKKKHHKGHKVNKVWLTFLKRAFSGAVNTDQLRQQFEL